MNTPFVEQVDQNEMDMKLFCEECKDIVSPGLDFINYLYESVSNHNAINKYLMESEIAYYAKYGTTLENADATGHTGTKNNIFKKALDMFFKWFNKVKKWFADKWEFLMDKFDQYISGNKAFLDKYRDRLNGYKQPVKFNGFTFSYIHSEMPKAYTITHNLNDTILKRSNGLSGVESSFVEKCKSEIVNKILKPNMPIDNLDDNIVKLMYGPKGEHTYDIKDQIYYIAFTNKDKSNANKMYKQAVNELKIMELAINKWKKEGESEPNSGYDIEKLQAYLQVIRFNLDVLSKAFSTYTEAVLARCKQAKAICMVAINSLNESANINYTSKNIKLRNTSLNDIYNRID